MQIFVSITAWSMVLSKYLDDNKIRNVIREAINKQLELMDYNNYHEKVCDIYSVDKSKYKHYNLNTNIQNKKRYETLYNMSLYYKNEMCNILRISKDNTYCGIIEEIRRLKNEHYTKR